MKSNAAATCKGAGGRGTCRETILGGDEHLAGKTTLQKNLNLTLLLLLSHYFTSSLILLEFLPFFHVPFLSPFLLDFLLPLLCGHVLGSIHCCKIS